ncbi:GNAT family N-acetyltransferase [Chitinimonas sp. PSY-7]|uniref:GNAT family N-acetyltransferase n=1 Tax=Chitinimonas sp. PSY-7 TaxID=3459088 RepID=UPI00403FDA8A
MEQFELVPYSPAHRPILRNMAELYSHDFSELTGMALKEEGTFLTEAQFEQYFIDVFSAFLIKADGKWAGFALVSDKSQLSEETGIHDVLQFFVLRAQRRHGLGKSVAKAVFDCFPGAWEVRQMDQNPAARAFWLQAISEYTQGNYSETRWKDEQGGGWVQRFHTP